MDEAKKSVARPCVQKQEDILSFRGKGSMSNSDQGVVFSGSEEIFQSKLLNINLIMFQLIIDVIYTYYQRKLW